MAFLRNLFHHSMIWLVLPIVVALATYVSIGRYFFPLLENYRENLIQMANERLAIVLDIGDFSGEWNRFDPSLAFEKVSIHSRYQDHQRDLPAIEVEAFSVELDSLSSFLYQLPVIRQASIQGVTLRLQQQEDLLWALKGWDQKSLKDKVVLPLGESTAVSKNSEMRNLSGKQLRKDVAPLAQALEFLLAQQHLKMESVWLEFYDRFGRQYRAFSNRLEIFESGGKQRIQGNLQMDAESAQQVAFIMEVSGDPFDQSSLDVQLYLQADSQAWDSWIEKFTHLLPVKIESLNAGVELWSHWKGGRLMSLKADLLADSLSLSSEQLPKLQLNGLNTLLHWQRQNNGWQLIADRLSLQLQKQNFPLQQVLVEFSPDQWRAQIGELDLQAVDQVLRQWPQLPDAALDALTRLKPTGKLSQLTLSHSKDNPLRVQTQLNDVSVAAYYGAPILQHVNGYVESTPSAGFIQFHSNQFAMGFPLLYSESWRFNQAQGQVNWEIGDAIRVYGQNLQLNQALSGISGEFDVLLHQQPEKDLFYLNIAVTDVAKEFGLKLVPDLIVDGALVEWLKSSIKAAKVSQGGFIYDGSLALSAKNPDRQTSTHLLLDVFDGELKFLPDWPKLTEVRTRLYVEGTELDAQVQHVHFLGNENIQGQVSLRDDQQGSVIGLNLQGPVVPEWGWHVLTKTPLSQLIPESLLHWQISGAPLALKTQLEFPLYSQSGKGYVEVRAKENQLLIPELSTPIRKINAPVRYDIEQGLTIQKGQAEFLSGVADFAVSTDMQTGVVSVSGLGRAAVSAINQWQPMVFSPWLSGSVDYQYQVFLGAVSHLKVESNLQGVAVDFPAPFGKTEQQTKNFSLSMDFSRDRNQFDVRYEKYLSAKGVWVTDQADLSVPTYSVSLWAGDVPEYQPSPPILNNTTLLSYTQSEVKIEPWLDFAKAETNKHALTHSISRSNQKDTTLVGSKNSPINTNESMHRVRWQLNTDRLSYSDFALNDVLFKGEMQGGSLALDIKSQELIGALTQEKKGAVINVQVDKFDYQRTVGSEKTTSEDLSLSSLFSTVWPNFDLQIRQLRFNSFNGQDLNASYRVDSEARQLKLHQMKQGSVLHSGTLDWLVSPSTTDSAQSALIYNISGGNLADMQKAMGSDVMVSSEKAALSTRLHWRGLPSEFDVETLSGIASVRLDKGKFEQVKSASALKLISLLNFESLIRRLQLDFSDLKGGGLSYNTVTGKISISHGQGELTEPLKVDGSSTKFEMKGQLNFVNETLDQELTVTLPVAETLPLAAILAGTPQIGGTIYLVQKVFGNLFDKFTRATYSIQGGWDQPQIELKRVF